jgi:single-strand DNA-binding protein
MSFLQLTVVGNLGKEPEMRYTAGGQAVTSFSVACSRKWTGADSVKHEETTWVRVSAWGKLAEITSQYLKKGHEVMVQGRLNPDASGGPKVFTKTDGTPGASYEMTAENVVFLKNGPRTAEGEGAPVEQEEVIPL